MGNLLDKISVKAISAFVFLTGLSVVFHIWFVRVKTADGIFRTVFPDYFFHWRKSALLLLGFFLIYQSFYLYRRSIASWWATVATLFLIFVLSATHRAHILPLSISFAALLLLAANRKKFIVKSELTDIKKGFAWSAIIFGIGLLYGTVGFWLLDFEDFDLDFGWGESFRRSLSELLLLGNGDLIANTGRGAWFTDSLHLLGMLIIAFIVYSFYRPLKYRFVTLPAERAAIEGILARGYSGDFGGLLLWPEDKAYYFSRSKRSALVYKVSGAVAICLGDPLGEASEFEAMVSDFFGLCEQSGWGLGFYGVSESCLDLFFRLKFKTVKIGEEARVDLGHFVADVLPTKPFRRVENKFREAAIGFAVAEGGHDEAFLDELARVSDEWLGGSHKERTFTVGYFDRQRLKGQRVFYLRESRSGRIIAFANELKTYSEGLASIDMMRYGKNLPNGAMDFLFLSIFKHCHAEGFASFGLGLAPLAGIGKKEKPSIEEKSLDYIFESSKRFFSFKGLRDYKAKFEPVWHDKHLAYKGSALTLAKLGLSLSRVTKK